MTRVAIQGIRGSYSEEAALRMFGESLDLVECSDFASAFNEAATVGTLVLVPVRNSIVGAIEAATGLVRSSGLKKLDEIEVRIEHILAGARNADLKSIERVRSHPEALKQCSAFLAANSHFLVEGGTDTASSVRDVAGSCDPTGAAIGSRRAVSMYGAKVLCDDVADRADNATTFYLLGK